MLVVAAAVVVTKWPGLEAAAHSRLLFAGGVMAFFPVWIGAGVLLALRRLKRRGLTVAADSQRYHEITWLALAALAVGVQAWLAGTMLEFVPKQPLSVRLVEALTGVFMIVVGNFAAKQSPPKGARAPDPAAWSRCMLRVGWMGVIAGFVVLIAAVVAPFEVMPWVIIGSAGTYFLAAVWQARAMRRKPA
jgi:hypothetical protein